MIMKEKKQLGRETWSCKTQGIAGVNNQIMAQNLGKWL